MPSALAVVCAFRNPWALHLGGNPAARMASDMKLPKPLRLNGWPKAVVRMTTCSVSLGPVRAGGFDARE